MENSNGINAFQLSQKAVIGEEKVPEALKIFSMKNVFWVELRKDDPLILRHYYSYFQDEPAKRVHMIWPKKYRRHHNKIKKLPAALYTKLMPLLYKIFESLTSGSVSQNLNEDELSWYRKLPHETKSRKNFFK